MTLLMTPLMFVMSIPVRSYKIDITPVPLGIIEVTKLQSTSISTYIDANNLLMEVKSNAVMFETVIVAGPMLNVMGKNPSNSDFA